MKTVKTIVAIAIATSSFNAAAATGGSANMNWSKTVEIECSIANGTMSGVIEDGQLTGDMLDFDVTNNAPNGETTLKAEANSSNLTTTNMRASLFSDINGTNPIVNTSGDDAAWGSEKAAGDGAVAWGSTLTIDNVDTTAGATFYTNLYIGGGHDMAVAGTYETSVTYTLTCF